MLVSLYDDYYTVLTIFRSLSPIAKHYILRILCMDIENIRPETFSSSVLTQHAALHREAIYKLRQLRIFQESPVSSVQH